MIEVVSAIAWVFHEESGTSRPNMFTVADSSLNFAPPAPTGLNGEAAKIIALGGDRVLCVYRNAEEPGLWGAVATVTADGLGNRRKEGIVAGIGIANARPNRGSHRVERS